MQPARIAYASCQRWDHGHYDLREADCASRALAAGPARKHRLVSLRPLWYGCHCKKALSNPDASLLAGAPD